MPQEIQAPQPQDSPAPREALPSGRSHPWDRSQQQIPRRAAGWFKLGAGESTFAADTQQRSPPLPAPPSLAKEAVCEVLFLPPHMPALMAGKGGSFTHQRSSGQGSSRLLLVRGHFTHVTVVTTAAAVAKSHHHLCHFHSHCHHHHYQASASKPS